MAEADPEYLFFLECEAFLTQEASAEIEARIKGRMAQPLGDRLARLPLEDRDGNVVVHSIAYLPQVEDVLKACRKAGVTARQFKYDRAAWQAEKQELDTLKMEFQNMQQRLNQLSTDRFQDMFVALMHLKVMRAYIEGVLRFGIERQFMIGLLCPRRGMERVLLQQMTEALVTDVNEREFYGEKMDVNEADDYWPFVSLPLTSPAHVFEH